MLDTGTNRYEKPQLLEVSQRSLAECTRAGVVIDAHPLPAGRGSDPAARVRGFANAVAERSFDNPLKLHHVLQYFAYPRAGCGGLQA